MATLGLPEALLHMGQKPWQGPAWQLWRKLLPRGEAGQTRVEVQSLPSSHLSRAQASLSAASQVGRKGRAPLRIQETKHDLFSKRGGKDTGWT